MSCNSLTKVYCFIVIIAIVCLVKSCEALDDLADLKTSLRNRSISFQDCGSKYEMLHLWISSCHYVPCKMHLGTNVSFSAEFDDFGENTAFLKHHVQWTLMSVNTPAAVVPDPCDFTKKCPFQGVVGKAFFATVYVRPNLPAVYGSLRWEAKNERGEVVICYKVPISIVWF